MRHFIFIGCLHFSSFAASILVIPRKSYSRYSFYSQHCLFILLDENDADRINEKTKGAQAYSGDCRLFGQSEEKGGRGGEN